MMLVANKNQQVVKSQVIPRMNALPKIEHVGFVRRLDVKQWCALSLRTILVTRNAMTKNAVVAIRSLIHLKLIALRSALNVYHISTTDSSENTCTQLPNSG